MRAATADFQLDDFLVGVAVASLTFAAKHMSKRQIIPFPALGINVIPISRAALIDTQLQDLPQLIK